MLLEEEKISYRNRVDTPSVTLWAMLNQVLSADKSLRNTVKCITTWLTAVGVKPPSSDTGAYSKARGRLPEELLQRLVPETAEGLEQQVPQEHYWCGRRVKAYDGTTVLMADSAANQAEYPQHGNQAEGCGFPIARVVVFFCLLTGAVGSACIAPWTMSEIVMSRLLYSDLEPNDVVMADQAYGSYVDLALIQQQGADGVLRKHHARHTDFRRGHKNGIRDHQVEGRKPTRCPAHMSEQEFSAIPDTLMVREVCLRLSRKGFRDEFIIVVTTLLDAQLYTAEQLPLLYGWRWQAESSQFASSQDHLEHGDGHRQNPGNGAKGNLGSSVGLQFVAQRDGTSCSFGGLCSYSSLFARDSSTVQPDAGIIGHYYQRDPRCVVSSTA